MFIQTEITPNPATVKFIPDQPILESGTAQFDDRDAAAASPLATSVFEVSGVSAVFLAPDFVSVTLNNPDDWTDLKAQVLGALMQHFASGQPALLSEVTDGAVGADDEPMVKKIKEVLEEKVRPAVAQDGGDIIFHSYKEGVVYLSMRGACAGCPSSTITLKQGIENLLKYYVPGVTAVEAVEA